ncbi:MAG: hypothetical protein WC757_03230 [Candidatus Paceibacterota bacterium]|jgi:hypothetical protein
MKNKLPLIVGLALPALTVVAIILAVYVPGMSIKPTYDFVYSDIPSNSYSYGYGARPLYGIDAQGKFFYNSDVCNAGVVMALPAGIQKLAPTEIADCKKNYAGMRMPKFYKYSFASGIQEIVTPEQLSSLIMKETSPEGYVVSRQYDNNGIFELFGSRGNNNTVFVQKGNTAHKVDLPPIQNPYGGYYNEFYFVGWVLK